MTDIKTQLDFMNKAWGGRSLTHAFIAEYGRDFTPAKLPKGIKRGKPKFCFMNAYRLADLTGFDYVEGYAMRPDLGIAMEHAWVADGSGNATDNTWDDPEKCSYRGVVIPMFMLRPEIIRLNHYGVVFTPRGPNIELIEKLKMEPGDLSRQESKWV